MRKTAPCVLVVLALALAGCSGSSSSSSASATVPQHPVTYADAPCPMPVPADLGVRAECGYLSVPENRLVRDSRTIRLAVLRLHSRSANPRPDPVIDLGGGPGFPALDGIANLAKSKILDTRDLIVWDQRGIGHSTPNLDCPEVNDAVWAVFGTVEPTAAVFDRIDTATQQCRDRLAGEGIDLNGYNTIENADDLADLRVALGVKEWNLHGGSYGTAVAIQELRDHPQGIHSVLLDSVVAPDVAVGAVARGQSALRSFDTLYQTCAEQPACHAKYGDLHALVQRAAASLDADPYRTTIPDPTTGQPRPIAIDGNDLWAGLFDAMYQANLIALIPSVMQSVADGNRAILGTLASQSLPLAYGAAEGMENSVDCADRQRLLQPEQLPPLLAAHPELGTLFALNAMEKICGPWGVKSLPASFNTLLRTRHGVPVLVAAGQFDPVTPPANSRRVADAMGAPFLLFPDAGHGAIGVSACSSSIWYAFMDAPTEPLDTSCMKDLHTITLQ